jgi:hypothetical protein
MDLLNNLSWEEEKRFFGFVIKSSRQRKENGIYKELKNKKLLKQLEEEMIDHIPFNLDVFHKRLRECNENLLSENKIEQRIDPKTKEKIYISYPLKNSKLSKVDRAFYEGVDFSK